MHEAISEKLSLAQPVQTPSIPLEMPKKVEWDLS